jgi:hypothetical protein
VHISIERKLLQSYPESDVCVSIVRLIYEALVETIPRKPRFTIPRKFMR